MNIMKIKNFLILNVFILTSCSLSPGMHLDAKSSWLSDDDFVFINDGSKKILVEDLTPSLLQDLNKSRIPYEIGIGDKLSITVWGLPDAFPMTNINVDQNLRVVNTDGTIFFPYAGTVQAIGKSQVELRADLTKKLSAYFNEPQLDVSIARFESQKVYILGEVLRPSKLPLTETPLSLADALGEVLGVNNNTSAGDQIFIIRQSNDNENERIFRANVLSKHHRCVFCRFKPNACCKYG